MNKTNEGIILLKYKTLAGQGFVSISDRWAGIDDNTVPEKISWDGFNAAKAAWEYVLYAFEQEQDCGLDSEKQLIDSALKNAVSDYQETLRNCAIGCSLHYLSDAIRWKYGKDANAILDTLRDGNECFRLIMRTLIIRAVHHLRIALEDVGAGDLMPEPSSR